MRESLVQSLVVITTAKLHLTKPELRFCAGSNPACGVLEIRDGEDLWQWSRLEIRVNAFHQSPTTQKQFIIIIIIIIISYWHWPKREKFIIVSLFPYTIGLNTHIYDYQSWFLLNYISFSSTVNTLSSQHLVDEQSCKKVQLCNNKLILTFWCLCLAKKIMALIEKPTKLHLPPCLVIWFQIL